MEAQSDRAVEQGLQIAVEHKEEPIPIPPVITNLVTQDREQPRHLLITEGHLPELIPERVQIVIPDHHQTIVEVLIPDLLQQQPEAVLIADHRQQVRQDPVVVTADHRQQVLQGPVAVTADHRQQELQGPVAVIADLLLQVQAGQAVVIAVLPDLHLLLQEGHPDHQVVLRVVHPDHLVVEDKKVN
jgi:hypothetical protein